MVAISDLISIFEATRTLVLSMKQHNKINDKKYQKALMAIYEATTKTKNYIASLETRQNHAKKKERELSELWINAGVTLRTIDSDLAQRCIIKADYWSNPNQWTDEQIKNSRITLDEIIIESRDLI